MTPFRWLWIDRCQWDGPSWLRRTAGLTLLGLAASGAIPSIPTSAAPRPLIGFDRANTEKQFALEAQFDALLQKENLREWMKRLTARPHHVGSPFGKEVAEFIAARFTEWGYETRIERFDVLFPTPKTRLLEMTAPESFKAGLVEPPLSEDATSGLTAEQLPGYNAYSIDGDVTGPLVYVNYGVPKDYEVLAERGISVQGKIVIARYGGSWRGIKPKVAAEHGAIGCLIYSDPAEDGYYEGEVYPKGAWRNEHGVQRGSVADLPVQPGDPLTPGIGATETAKRLSLKEATNLTKIPVLPISYADALPLLRALGGPVAPEGWRGALPLTYHFGPGPAIVRLRLEFEWPLVPAYDVIGRLPGAECPDQWVLRGNHHDAWVFGAEDPISGTVALMEEARAIGALVKAGWKPKRTILFAAWDAEEPGLLGSTEWVEAHEQELRDHGVAYINGDNNSRGFLRAGGSHTLERFVNEIARDVTDPVTHVSVGQRVRAKAIASSGGSERREARDRADWRIHALGSGSDFTPFLQHAGLASLDIRYSGEGEGGSYHSIYDSYDHYTRFVDPDFAYGLALAQTSGRAVLRLANADTLPFEFNNFAETVGRYLSELTRLAEAMREEAQESVRQHQEKSLELAADPSQTFIPPSPKAPVPFLNFAPLQNAVESLRTAAHQFEQQRARMAAEGESLKPEAQRQLDGLLMRMERLLVSENGLPRRPWYKHLLYAPGYYTGYAVKTLPAIREAIEERQWHDVDDQIALVSQALRGFTDHLEQAERLLQTKPAP